MNPLVFAAYWLTLRACIACSSFLFHHLLHNRDGVLGSFTLPPAVLRCMPVAALLFGVEPVVIVRDHRVHHAFPGVRALALPVLARDERVARFDAATPLVPAVPR